MEKKQNALQVLQKEVSTAKNVKDILKIDLVKDRFISNYKGVSGRSDGETRYEREAFAFIDLANSKPEIMECDPFSIMAGFIKAGVTGCSFTDGKLSVYPRGVKQKDGTFKKMLVVEPDAHGKREMLERMATIRKVDHGVIVYKDDVFIVDPHSKKVVKHEQKWPIPKASKETVVAAYCTVHFTDNTTEDVVMSIHEIEIARSKSKMQEGGQLWKEHYAEACKKTTYNRAFKVFHKLPDTVVTFPQFEGREEEQDTKDISHNDVSDSFIEPIDEKVEEVPTEEVEVVEDKPKAAKQEKKQQTKKEETQSETFLD